MTDYATWEQFAERIEADGDRLKSRIEVRDGELDVGDDEQWAFSRDLMAHAGKPVVSEEMVPPDRMAELAQEIAERRDMTEKGDGR